MSLQSVAMGTKSREVIWGTRMMGAEIRAKGAREAAKAAKETDRTEAEVWSIRVEGYGGPAQPSPTIEQCLRGGLGRCTPSADRGTLDRVLPVAASEAG
jgi:hypothetical protein